jgi:hypothetical protein
MGTLRPSPEKLYPFMRLNRVKLIKMDFDYPMLLSSPKKRQFPKQQKFEINANIRYMFKIEYSK